MNDKTFTFIKKASLGDCPCCNQKVFDNQLYVFEHNEENYYHFSCYNHKMKDKEDNE